MRLRSQGGSTFFFLVSFFEPVGLT